MPCEPPLVDLMKVFYTDKLSVYIYERTTAVAWVNRGIRLNQVFMIEVLNRECPFGGTPRYRP